MLLLAAAIAAIHLTPPAPPAEYRQPQLAASSQMVAMTFGSGNAVFFSASRDGGRTFSKPVKVAESTKLYLGRHRGPRVAITPSAIVISAIVGESGDLKSWRSTDGGKSWAGPVTVNDVPAASREGLHAMAAGGNVLFATWLDLRTKGMKLYGARSEDGGATWSKNISVYESPDGTICTCCHPSLAVDAKGTVHVMWRNVLAGNRDMYVARSGDGGRTFAKAIKSGEGTWPLNACPMDGGGLAITEKGEIVSAWRRDKEVFLAGVAKPESKMEVGKDPAIAAGPGGIYAVWSSGEAVHARIPGKPQPVTLAARGAYPQVVAVPGGAVLAAWESKGEIVVLPLR
ncbi:MAG: sialidase family protein [Bryobacteraceae bacterium]